MEGAPSSNLYLADLPPDVDEAFIRSVFGEFGTITQCRAMQGKFPGQKGAALVRYATVDEASWVVANINGQSIEGASIQGPIQVRFATNKAANGKAQEKGGGWGWGADGGDYGWGGDGGWGSWSGYGGGYGKAGAGADAWSGGQGKGMCGHRLVPYEPGKGAITPVAAFDGAPAAGGKKGGAGAITPVAAVDGAPAVGGKKGGAGKGAPGSSCSSCDVGTFINGLISAQALPGLGRKPEDHSLYVKGLPYNTTDADLYRLFSPFGAIPPRGVKTNVREDGSCSGVAWVDFCDASAAQAAILALNGINMPDGVELHVSIKKSKP